MGLRDCDSFDPGAGGDFELHAERTVLFGNPAAPSQERYEVIGFTSLF